MRMRKVMGPVFAVLPVAMLVGTPAAGADIPVNPATFKYTGGTFLTQPGGGWLEKRDTGVDSLFAQTGRTAEYVELFDAARQTHVRLFADKAMFRDGLSPDWLAWPGSNGDWQVGSATGFEQVFQQVIADYERKIKQIEREARGGAEDIEKDTKNPSAVEAAAGVKVELTGVEHKLLVPTPVVTVKPQTFCTHIPQVVGMVKNEIVYNTPSVRMVMKVIGRYPRIDKGGVTMEDITTEVPEVFQQEQRVAVHYPKVAMARHDFTVNMIGVRIETRELQINIPSQRPVVEEGGR